jgi:hypothetical protein
MRKKDKTAKAQRRQGTRDTFAPLRLGGLAWLRFAHAEFERGGQ